MSDRPHSTPVSLARSHASRASGAAALGFALVLSLAVAAPAAAAPQPATAAAVPGVFISKQLGATAAGSVAPLQQGGCNQESAHSVAKQPPDAQGGISVNVDYSTKLTCSDHVTYAFNAILVDRTPGVNGRGLDAAPDQNGTVGTTQGSAVSRKVLPIPASYIGADRVEVLFSGALTTTDGAIWGPCSPPAGVTVIRCDGVGTTRVDLLLGFGEFATEKVRGSCDTFTFSWLAKVTDINLKPMAVPSATYQWCAEPNGNVTDARIVGAPQPRPGSNMIGIVVGDPTPKPYDLGGRRAFRSTFAITYTIVAKYITETGIDIFGNTVGVKKVYDISSTCTISVDITLSGRFLADTSVNPCDPWTPPISFLNTDKPSYQVGDTAVFRVSGAAPNTSINWTVTVGGAPTTALSSCLNGRSTDGSGNWSGSCAAPSTTGEWVAQARVGSATASAAFDVRQQGSLSATLGIAQFGKCLDAGTSASNGTTAYTWQCVTGAANHQWRANPIGPDTYLLVSAASGRCLDSGLAGTNGTTTYTWDCVPGAANHQWRITQVGQSTYRVASVLSGKCLDSGLSADNGTSVYTWDCVSGAANQQWRSPGATA